MAGVQEGGMTPRDLIAVFIRIVGIYSVHLALVETSRLLWFRGIAHVQFPESDGARDLWVAYVGVGGLWALAIGLIVFSNAIAAILALGLAGSTEQPLPSIGLSLGECSRLAYRLAGVVLCILALKDAAATVAWWYGEVVEQDGTNQYQLASHLVGPASQFALGAVLAAVGSRSARRA
jgi:hypothetical protein